MATTTFLVAGRGELTSMTTSTAPLIITAHSVTSDGMNAIHAMCLSNVRKTHSMLFKQFGRDLPSSRAATPMLILRNLLPLNVVDNLPHNYSRVGIAVAVLLSFVLVAKKLMRNSSPNRKPATNSIAACSCVSV